MRICVLLPLPIEFQQEKIQRNSFLQKIYTRNVIWSCFFAFKLYDHKTNLVKSVGLTNVRKTWVVKVYVFYDVHIHWRFSTNGISVTQFWGFKK